MTTNTLATAEATTAPDKPDFSTDERAETIMGRRDVGSNVVILNSPAEEGFVCPGHEAASSEDAFETLHWGEYNAFLWCSTCNKDIPAALCATGNRWNRRDESTLDAQIRVYLDTVEQAEARVARAVAAAVNTAAGRIPEKTVATT